MQEDDLRRSLRTVARALDRLTANWFLEGGSCLGYLRCNRAIAWDADVDIGIYDPEFDLRKLAKRLPVDYLFGYGTDATEARMHLSLPVEIFRFFDHRGHVAESLYHLKRNEVKFLLYPKDIFESGVERVLFYGVECNVLRRSHEYCSTLYGESYLIPDPLYSWWEGPRNGVMMNPEAIFRERVSLGFWDDLRRVWLLQGPAAVARRGLRRIGRRLATVLLPRVAARK